MRESFSLLNTFPAQPQTHCLSKGRTLVTATQQEPEGLRTHALKPGLGRGVEKGGERKGRGATEKVKEGQKEEEEMRCGESMCVGEGKRLWRGLEGVESAALPQGSVV